MANWVQMYDHQTGQPFWYDYDNPDNPVSFDNPDPAKFLTPEQQAAQFQQQFPNAIYNAGNEMMNWAAPVGSGTEYWTDYLNQLMASGTPIYRPNDPNSFSISPTQYEGWIPVTEPFERQTHNSTLFADVARIAPFLAVGYGAGAALGGLASGPSASGAAAGETAGATAGGASGSAGGTELGLTGGGAFGTAGTTGISGGGAGTFAGGALGTAATAAIPTLLDSAGNPQPQSGGSPGTDGGSLAPQAGTSALSRLLDGTATTQDYLSLLGTVGSTGLGMYGAGQQANALRDIANQARADRQPFLSASTNWLNNPQAYAEGPGKTFMDSTLRRLSAEHGNPIDSPTALGLATQAGLSDWRNAVTGFGNLGLAGQDSRMNIQAQAAGSDSDVLNALGYGIGRATQPRQNYSLLSLI